MKRKFESGDYVKFSVLGQDEYEYGYLDRYDKESKTWGVIVENSDSVTYISADTLTYMPYFIMSGEFLKKLIRYEATYKDYVKNVTPDGNWRSETSYEFSLGDMTAMIENLQKKNWNYEEFSDWAELVFGSLDDFFVCEGKPKFDSKHLTLGFSYPQNDAAMATAIYQTMYEAVLDGQENLQAANIDLALILEDIENYYQKKPIRPFL